MEKEQLLERPSQPSLKVWRWLPVILWMSVIFLFSSNPHSNSDTERIFHGANFYIRKCAHMTEFAILFLLVKLAIAPEWDTTSPKGTNRFVPNFLEGSSFIAILATIAYSCTDEFHQLFVPGRSGSVHDVLVDSVGASVALIGCFLNRRFLRSPHSSSTEP